MKPEDIHAIKQKWEGDRIEYKRCGSLLSKDIWESVSAFANEGGGYLFLGYEKAGDTYIPAGIENSSKILDDFTSTVGQKFNFCPMVNALAAEDEGKAVIVIEVKEALRYQKPIYIKDAGPFKGGFKRLGASDVRLSDDDISRYFRERLGAPDAQAVPDTTLADIEGRALSAFRQLRKMESPDAPELDYDTRELLQAYNLISKDGESLTVAALLLFGKAGEIKRMFPAFRLDIIRIKGTEWGKDRDPFLSRDLKDNLLSLRAPAMDFLERFFLVPFHADARGDRISENAHRKSLREALTNLLMHQNYFHPQSLTG